MRYGNRPGRPADAPHLGAVESAAAQRFGAIGMTAIAEGRPTDPLEYRALAEAGRLWVAEKEEGSLVGLAIAGAVDGEGCLAEVSVHPDHGRRGHGRWLIEAVEDWARGQGHGRIFLTTFRDVAWNRSLYERLGYGVVEERDLGPELRAIRDEEGSRGLDRVNPRVAMAKVLSRDELTGGPPNLRPSGR